MILKKHDLEVVFPETVSVLISRKHLTSASNKINMAGLIDCSHNIIMCELDYIKKHDLFPFFYSFPPPHHAKSTPPRSTVY